MKYKRYRKIYISSHFIYKTPTERSTGNWPPHPDFDDALSVENLPNGDLRVGIHIADVSSYVKAGTALDTEAQRRGNSTYLVGTVVPMLPHELSNGLCSLVEGEDRLTKAVLLTFHKGRLHDTAFANTVIRSRKRLTYHQAYALLKEDSLDKIRRLPVAARAPDGLDRPGAVRFAARRAGRPAALDPPALGNRPPAPPRADARRQPRPRHARGEDLRR